MVGGFWVSFLSYTAPGFQLWFYFLLYMGVVYWGLAPEAALEGLGSPLLRARCRSGASAWVAGVLASPGTQGLVARAAGNIVLSKGMATSIGQYTPVFLPGEPP